MNISRKMNLLFFSLVITLSAFKGPRALASFDTNSPMPHMDLEMGTAEYEAILNEMEQMNLFSKDSLGRGEFDDVRAMGQKNLQWLVFINDNRAKGQKLSFSSAATQPAYAIDNVNKYNVQIITKEFVALKAQMPQVLKDVLFDGKPMTRDVPMKEDEYLEWGRKVDRVYDRGMRWLTMKPYLGYLAQRKTQDIRGFYFLSQEQDIETKLSNWNRFATIHLQMNLVAVSN